MLVRAALILFSAVAIGSAAHDVPRNTRYLALGDSVAFGFSPLIAPTNTNAFSGYPDIVSKALHKKVNNASCFGESSGSFLAPGAPDRGCALWRSAFPLQADYNGSQLQYALAYLAVNAKKTDLVTISLGANDLGVLLFDTCAGDVTCATLALPATLAAYNANLVAIFSAMRAVYDGPIVAVNAYAVNYANPVELQGLIPLNGVLASAASAFVNIQVADAFGAFGAATIGTGGDSCEAGLLIRKPDNTCDIHPSAAGHALIAEQVLRLVPKK
jgi:lysophospholipase L1-like esterase